MISKAYLRVRACPHRWDVLENPGRILMNHSRTYAMMVLVLVAMGSPVGVWETPCLAADRETGPLQGSFSGAILLDQTTGIKRAVLKLKEEGNLVRELQVTDGEPFQIDAIPAGRYDLVIEAKSHSTFVEREGVTIQAGQRFSKGVHMIKAPFRVTEGAATKTILCSACHKAIYYEMIRGVGTDFLTGPWPDAEGNLIHIPDHLDFYSNSSPEHLAYVSPITVATIAKQLPAQQDACRSCHAPTLIHAEGGIQAPGLRDENRQDGVSCVSCHLDTDGNIRGKYDLTAPHPTVQDAHFTPEKSAELCAACHQSDTMAPNQQTVAEWRRDFMPRDPRTCQDCHMPPVTRRLSEIFPDRPERVIGRHLFAGGHSLPMLKDAALLEIRREGEAGHRLKIAVTNTGAGHSLPTGHGPRAVLVKVMVEDAQGKRVALGGPTNGLLAIYTVNPSLGPGTPPTPPAKPAIRAGRTEESILDLEGLPKGRYQLRAQLLYDLDRLVAWNDEDLPVIAEGSREIEVE
jgi:nitrate/TMAO reductase-like tetraheme cytochrome c subunit